MADTWQAISGYASNNYSDTMVFEVDAETKKLAKLSGQTLVAGEKNSQYIRIKMPRYWDGIDISEMNIGIIYDLNNGEYFGTTQAISAERTADSIRFGWVVPEGACAVKGTLLFVIIVKGTDYILKMQIAETPVVKSLSEDGDIPEPTKETWYADFQVRVERTLSAAENAVEEAHTVLEQARSFVGSPLVAETAAAMVDTERIYVYTGSESGYTSGNWYYYNTGTSAWVSGGVYNAVAVDTDTTLSIAGKAADAKETGDQITELKSGFNDLYNTAYVTDSASGEVAHFVDGADNVPMKSLKVNIEPVQSGSGDPSPDNVRPISGFNSVKVMRAGKNLIDYLSCIGIGPRNNSESIYGNYTSVSGDILTINLTYSSNGGILKGVQHYAFPKGTTFTVRLEERCTGDQIAFGYGKYEGGGTNQIKQRSVTPDVWTTITETFTAQGGDIGLFIQPSKRDTSLDVRNVQLELGSTATAYEPYSGQTYDITFPTEAGTVYGGTLDAISGVLTVDRAMITLNGTQNIANVSARANSVRFTYGASAQCKQTGVIASDVICDKLPSILYTWGTDQIAVSLMEGYNRIVCGVPISAGTTNTDIKAWLASNPLQIVYKLAEPLTYQLSAIEIKSLLGINNIWSDAGDIEVEYRADTKLYIKRLTDSDTDMVADSNITSGQYFMAGNDLYKATVNIASGAQIVVGTNATKVSLSEALNQIKEA